MALPGFENIDTDCPPALQEKARTIASWLATERRIVPGEEIARRFKLTDTGRVRAAVSWLRCQGDIKISCVASSGKGYWWEPDRTKLRTAMEHMRARALKELAAYEGSVNHAFGRAVGQGELL